MARIRIVTRPEDVVRARTNPCSNLIGREVWILTDYQRGDTAHVRGRLARTKAELPASEARSQRHSCPCDLMFPTLSYAFTARGLSSGRPPSDTRNAQIVSALTRSTAISELLPYHSAKFVVRMA